MKKFFALVLAVAMIMSMAAVSFAATNTVSLYGPWDYDADTDKVRTTGIQYGDSVLFLLTENAYSYKDDKGNTTITIVFNPSESGTVYLPSDSSLKPMTLYAHFEEATAE